MSIKLPNNGWKGFFEKHSSAVQKIENKLDIEDEKYVGLKIFPPRDKIFRAFELCDLEHTKVVIIGQDCYHGLDQANGLCFSVDKGMRVPPSLRNILKEMKNDLGDARESSDFSNLASQGVLLLNCSLTVLQSSAGSHMKIWEDFTNKVIESISKKRNNLIFILWGNYAKSKKKFIHNTHIILEGHHPSPLSANRGGFFGGKYFSKTNYHLKNIGEVEIKWV